MDNSKKKLIAFITVFLLLFTTFAYSALSTSLTITANAKFRVLANIRVDDIGLKSTNNSLISYDSEYTKNTISSGFKLTSTSSSIDYNVVVNNNGNIDQVIYQISTVSSNNDGIIIYIDDEPMNDKLPYKIPIGTTNIKITYKTTSPSNQTINIVNQFDFRKLYSVDYNSKGGSQIASQDKIEDVDLTLTNNVPTKQGYTFAGWTDEENGTTAKFQAGSKYTLNKSIILYALYTRNTYNITYTLNGGTNDSNNPSTYNVESNDITLKDASKAGWTFTGWTGNGTTTPTKNLKLSKGSTGNKTFVAHFEKTITLTQKHGTTTTTQNYNLKDLETEHTFTLQNSVDSFPGWTFDGWLNDPTPKAKDYNPTGSITISTDKTVYATYKKELTTTFIDYTGITKQTRTVKGTAYGNNGCGGVGNQYPTVTSLTVSNYTDWTKLGWTTSTSASASVSLNSNTNYTLTDDKATTYYALYKQDVTLTYNSNGGSTKPSDETKQRKVNSYSNTTFSHPTFTLKNTATKTGYTLSKWTISAPISADKNPTDSITIESGNSVTATAKWSTNTYSISYTLNGGGYAGTECASENSTCTFSGTKQVCYGAGGAYSCVTATDSVSCTNSVFTDPTPGIAKKCYVTETTVTGTYDSNVLIENPTKKFVVKINPNSQGATIKNASGTAVTSASSSQTFAGWTSSVGTNAKTGTTTSDYVTWDGTSTTNTYFKNLTDTNSATVTMIANWNAVNVTLPNITKTGYTCGYATSASGEVVYQSGGSYTPSTTIGGAELFAKCNANPYTVTYNGNGNTGGSTSSSSHTYDTAKKLTKNGFTKTGYVFAGWNTKANGTGTTYTDEQSVTNLATSGNVNLYAQWTANTYTVAYTMNGAAAKANQSVSYDSNLTLAKPTKTFTVDINANSQGASITSGGTAVTSASSTQTFAGWTGTNLSSTAVYGNTTSPSTAWNGTTKIGTSDATIYLKNLRTTSGTVTLTANWTAVNVTLPKIEKTGYTCGYATSATGSITYNSEGTYSPSATSGSTTLYAKCNIIPYTITYNLDGGSVSTANPTSYNVTTATFTLNNPTKVGYTFAGWTGSNGTTAQTTVSITKGSTGNRTYTTNWTANTYTVIFDKNSTAASGTMSNQTFNYDEEKKLSKNTFSRTGYTFEGWNVLYSSNNEKTSNYEFMQYADLAPYIDRFGGDKEYILEFDIKSSDTSKANKINVYCQNGSYCRYSWNKAITVSSTEWTHVVYKFVPGTANTSETKAMLAFYGTYNTGNNPIVKNVRFSLSPKYSDEELVSNLTSEQNGEVTLYAGWTANQYTVTYNGNGNSAGSTATSTHTYDEAKALTSNGFTRVGHTFAGWNTKADGTGTAYTNGQSVTNLATSGNVNLYAQWTANTYTVAYTMNGAAAKANQSVSYDSNLTLAKPTKTFTVNIDANSQGATIKNASGTAVTSASSTQTFAGWTGTNLSSSTAVYGNTTSPSTTWNGTTKIGANDATIYLKNLRTTSGTVTLTANWTAVNVTLPNITKTGYTCGYATSAGGNIAYQTGGSYTPSTTTGSVTLFAKCNANQYTVTYNGNGNTGGSTTASSHTYDEAKTLTKNGFTKTGYTFAGWNTKADGSGTNYEDEESVTNLVTSGNFNLYAVWAPNTNTAYTVYHYIKDLGANTYSLNNTENKTGTSDASLTLANLKKTITGFTYSNGSLTGSTSGPGTVVTTTTIAADGTREIYLFYTRDTHTVTLTKGTGINTVTGAGTYEYGASVTINNTLNAGYSFVNWTVGTTSTAFATSQSKTFTMGTSDVTYKANGQLINYTITYNLNGGSVSTANPTTYNVTTDTFTLNNPTKTGYTFGGWTGSNGTTAQTSVSVAKGSTGNKSYTANYTAKTYILTLKPNGGKYNNSTSDATKTMTYDSTNNNSIGTASKTGYTFNGWWTASSGGTQVYNANGQNVNASAYWTAAYNTGTWKYDGAVTLYAQFTKNDYSIAFNSNAPTGETVTGTMANLAMKYDEAKNLTSNGYTISGYTFAGWNTKADGTGTAYLDGTSVSNLATSGTVTLYAQWTVNTVTIGLQKDGSAYSNSGIKVTLYDGTTATSFTSTISSGSTVTFTKVPAKTYNIYVGEDTNHKTTMVDSNVDVVVNSSSTSQTVKFYTLTIGLSNTTTTVNGTSVSNNGTVVVAEGYAHAVVAAANTGYEFVNNSVIWSNTGTMTIANTKAASTTVVLSSAGKLTSTATAKSYVVTAKANNGSIASTTGWTGTGTSATKSVTYKGTYGTLPSVSRTGYTLAGWNTKDDGTGTTITSSTTVNTASAHDIYAIWTPNTYSVKFNANGGSGSMSNESFTYDSAKELTSNAFTRTGYTFNGWNTKADGTGTSYTNGQSVSNLSSTNDATVNLYAQWTKNNYTLTFDANGGSISTTTKSVTYGTTYTDLPTPTRAGYTFKGWYADLTGNSDFINYGREYTYTNKISIHVSAYMDDWSDFVTSNARIYSCTESGGWNIEPMGGYFNFAVYNTSYKSILSNVKISDMTSGWHDFDLIFDGTYASAYIDGINVGTSKAFTSSGIGYNPTNSIFIGAEATSSPSNPSGGQFNGYIGNIIIKNNSNLISETTYNTFSAPAQDLTLKAKWVPNTYSVKFNANGGSGTMSNESFTYDSAKALTSNAFTRTGYTFNGWNTSSDGTETSYTNEQSVSNLSSTNDATVNLYAQWVPNTYSIKFNANGGTGTMSNESFTYDTTKALTSNAFTRTGYTFAGWSTSSSDKSLIIDDTEYHKDSTNITSNYQELKLYSVEAPFTSGEVYQLEFDAKGTGNLTTYFYGVSGYLQVSNVTNSGGWNGSYSDGYNNVALTSNYKHYSVRFTLGSTGDGTKTKYVLLRAFKGNDCYAKNIRFFKVSSTSTAYTNEQSVINLATTGNVNLYAMWLANELIFGNQTITKTFSTSSQTANVTAATNGTGTYTYSKVSGESDITVSSAGVITVPASKAANTTGYSVVVRATDSNSGKTKDATYTIKINKATNPLSVTASQTWSEAFSTSAKDKAIASSNGVGTLSYAIQSQKNTSGTTVTNFSISGSNLRRAASTPVSGSNYTVVVRVTAAGNDNYNSGYKDITYTVTVSKAACLMTLTNASMYTGATLDLTTKTSNAVGGVSYAIKTNGTTTASTLSGTNNKTLTAGAMSSANDTAQSVVVTATEAATTNYSSCSKDMTVTVNKNANTLAANSKTVYVNSVNNYADIIKTNNGGALTASVTSDGTTGGSNDTTNKKYTAGVLSASNDNNGSVVLSVTSARTTTVAEKTVSVTLTVQKYTNALSFVSPTPAANAALAYNTSYTAKAQAETNGGTNGSITYSSGTTAAMTINSTSGAITVAKADGTTSVITASMARTTTVKAASITRTFSTTKGTCPAPTNLAISNAGIVTWTNASGASSYEISIDNTTFTAATSGVNYKSTITAATGTRTVYVRSVCDTTYYSAANSANASKATTVYSVTLTKGTGIKSVSGAGNYITGATVTLGATADTGYTWSKWTQTSGGTAVSTTNAYSAAISGNWAYTANATANPYTVTAKANSGSIASTTGWTGTGTSATKSVTYKGTYGTLPTVSRTGYTLAGWNTKDDGTGTDITASTTVNTASAHDIYAIWVPSEISLADKTLSAGTYGTAYTSNAFDAATNGTGSYTYTLSNAPTGATINSTNRTISFTASTAAGTYNVTVTATDNETSKTDSATMTIVINKRNVTLTAGSTSRAWNNQALTNNTCTGNNLVSGHTVTCSMTSGSTITLAGSVDNVISTYSIKSGTTDLTSNYNVTTAKGTLTVTVATPTVTLTAKTDAQRTYTGSVIAANAATVSPNSTPTITYKYYTDSACSAGETTTAPTNAGTYYAKAYAAAVTNKTAAASSTCVNHSILKAAATNTVAITGTNTWGSTLTATITTNSDGAKGYQWYYSGTAGATSGGTAISGATSATYTIDKSLIGKYIYVVGTVGAGTNWNAATNSVDATDATTNTTQAVDKKTLSVTRTNYSAQYDAAAHGVIVKVTNSDWDGKAIVSGTSTSYGTTVTSTGAYNTNYTLSPTYTDYAASARTVYYKVTGGSYYKDYTGSGTVTISKKTATNTIKITGTNTWGSTLTATLTTNSNGTKSYKWYYSSTAGATSGGTAVGDTNCNTGSTCVIPSSLVGKYIYVVGSVGASTNYTTPADSVDATDATANGTQAVAKKTGTNSIKITGTNTWGSTLTATITTNSDGTKSYKWYYSSTAGATSGGTAVGATNCNTGNTCVIPNTLVGKYIYVVGSVGTSTYYTTPSDSVDATDATANTTQAVAKKTCPAPTNVAIATDKKVSWTNASGASSYQISIDGTTFAAHTNGAAYNSITAATGTRTVYVRSVCDTTYYSAANSANASKSTTVYSVTLTAGTGVSAVSGAGNYITGASASIDATVKTGYTWTNWTGSSTITTKATSVTVNDNKSYTANATPNTYTIAYTLNGGTNVIGNPLSGTYDESIHINYPSKTYTLNFNDNSQGATIKDYTGNTISNISFIVYFEGWTSNDLGSNALKSACEIPSDNCLVRDWNGDLSIAEYFKNLKESGIVTMVANWNSEIVILPSITKSGYLCGYSSTASGNIEYYAGDTFTTSSDTGTSETLYAKCVKYDYTIAYTMNGGELPSSHPEGGFTNQDVYITNPSTKNVTINFNNTQGATIKNSSNQTITSMTSSQTFKGWASSSYQSNAKTGTTSNPTTSWTGSLTKNTHFKDLRNSGTIYMVANWNSSSITLPNATLSGRNCGYAPFDTSNIEYSNGQSYSVGTTLNSKTLYVRCLMAENLEYNTNLGSGSGLANTTFESLNNLDYYHEDAQYALDVIADFLK